MTDPQTLADLPILYGRRSDEEYNVKCWKCGQLFPIDLYLIDSKVKVQCHKCRSVNAISKTFTAPPLETPS